MCTCKGPCARSLQGKGDLGLKAGPLPFVLEQNAGMSENSVPLRSGQL